MKIKRFNESFAEKMDNHPYIDLRAGIVFKDYDLSRIHRKGRKVYVITKKYEVREIIDPRFLKMSDSINKHCPYAIVIKEEDLPIVDKYCAFIKETEELHNKKLNLYFQHMISSINEKEEKGEK